MTVPTMNGSMGNNSVNNIIAEAKSAFEFKFLESPTLAAVSPGRVNLIGEHVDYCDGLVMPMAIPLYTVVVGKPIPTGTKCHIRSMDVSDSQDIEIDLTQPIEKSIPRWSNYLRGVLVNFQAIYGNVCGFNALIKSNLPLGAGLSSSAALEVSFCTFLVRLCAMDCSSLSNHNKALLCQKAEHDFAGVPCGIMDQFIASMGQEGHALLIDCRSYEVESLPLDDPSLAILVTNSNVRHTLMTSEYAERKWTCEEAAKSLDKKSLRDLTLKELDEKQSKLDPLTLRRVRHVVSEIGRVSQAAEALRNRNYSSFGALMSASHCSLRDDFEVSCYELDQLVDLASSQPGVHGTRMTGGGFGGCTVTLLDKEAVEPVMKHIKENYTGQPTFYLCTPVDGASLHYL